VLAAHAKLRAAVVPDVVQPASEPSHEYGHTHGQAARISWGGVLKRVFDIDVKCCACGGHLKIIAAIGLIPAYTALASKLRRGFFRQ
jgi:hypothetical protein